MTFDVSRRSLLGIGLLGGGSIVGKFLPRETLAQNPKQHHNHFTNTTVHGGSITVGDVDNDRNGFSPRDILTDWNGEKVAQLPNGQTLREYDIAIEEREIEIALGVLYPAWTYDGRVRWFYHQSYRGRSRQQKRWVKPHVKSLRMLYPKLERSSFRQRQSVFLER